MTRQDIKIINTDYRHTYEAVHDVDAIGSTLMARDYKDAQRVAVPVITRNEKLHEVVDLYDGYNKRWTEDPSHVGTLTANSMTSTTHSGTFEVGMRVEVSMSDVDRPGIYVQISKDVTVYAVWYPKKECYIAIRKLTPKECFRLQGWTDDYFTKAQFVSSNSQLYKQAGNGVTVNVIEAIARRLGEENGNGPIDYE